MTTTRWRDMRWASPSRRNLHFAWTDECRMGDHELCDEQAVCFETYCYKDRQHSCACECHMRRVV